MSEASAALRDGSRSSGHVFADGVRVAAGRHRLLGREDRILAGASGLGFFERVQLIEPLDEEQVGELLDDRDRIRDAAGLSTLDLSLPVIMTFPSILPVQ